jgi:glycosyltransferase involved in cell wall biosynthesis
MKIVIQHHLSRANAEQELARRMRYALEALGHQVAQCETSDQIEVERPDLVFATHMDFAKLTDSFTLGCMWNPPTFFVDEPQLMKNILSYDGFSYGAASIQEFLKHLCFGLGRTRAGRILYPSAGATPFQAHDFKSARLSYVGTNWDGLRHGDMLAGLSTKDWFDVFGPAQAWQHAPHIYRGEPAFDGRDLIATLARGGISLCLHRAEHLAWGVPNMRVFESAAASNVLICDDHAFVRTAYGDSAHYLDHQLPFDGLVDQISWIVSDIRANPQRATEMAKACHERFTQSFSLETLLGDVLSELELPQSDTKLRSPIKAGGVDRPLDIAPKDGEVTCIVRCGFRSTQFLKRALASIQAQTRPISKLIIVNHNRNQDVLDLCASFLADLDLEIIQAPSPANRSLSLWAGLKQLKTEYFCILDDDDTYSPEHIDTLLKALSEAPQAVASYAGSVRILEAEPGEASSNRMTETRDLAYLEPFNIRRLIAGPNYIPSNAFLARTSGLTEALLDCPDLEALEDYALLLGLLKAGPFVSILATTSQIYWRAGQKDNITFDRDLFERCASLVRARLMFDSLTHQHDVNLHPIIREDALLVWQRAVSRRSKTNTRACSWRADKPAGEVLTGCIDKLSQIDQSVWEVEGWAPVTLAQEPAGASGGVLKRLVAKISSNSGPNAPKWTSAATGDLALPLVFSCPSPIELVQFEVGLRPDVCRARKDWSYFRSGFKAQFRVSAGWRPEELSIYAAEAAPGPL